MEDRKCKWCGSLFRYRLSRGRDKGKYCSVDCQHKGSVTGFYVPCAVCQENFFVQPHRLKTGRGKFCSKKCTHMGIYTEEVRQKMSEKKRGVPVPSRQGEGCHFWKGGVTSDNKKIRMSTDMRVWRESVFKRDDYTCQMCGERGGELQADHIKPFCAFPELRFDLSNGRTLCVACHKTTDTYGGRSNKK